MWGTLSKGNQAGEPGSVSQPHLCHPCVSAQGRATVLLYLPEQVGSRGARVLLVPPVLPALLQAQELN